MLGLVGDAAVRRAARVDRNQAALIKVLRKLGATVQPLHMVGRGVPDLLVGFRGKTLLVELKDGEKSASRRKLTPDQSEWISAWRGGRVHVVTSVDDVLAACGL